MSRYSTRAIAGLAGLALSATAFGAAGDLTPVHPVDGNFEVVYIGTQGNNLIVVSPTAVGTAVTLAGSGDGGAFVVTPYDADGVAGGSVNVPEADITFITDGGVAGDIEAGDVIQIDLSNIRGNINGFKLLDVTFLDGDASMDSFVLNADGTDGGGNDATDERFELITDNPTLSAALRELDGDMSQLFLTVEFPTYGFDNEVTTTLKFADNGGVDNPADTGTPDFGDFEKDTDGDDTFEALDNPDDADTFNAPGDDDIFLSIDFDAATSDFADDIPVQVEPGAGDVYDGAGGRVLGDATIEDKEALAIAAAEWVQTISNGATVIDALKVTWNLPLDPADLGDADFYDDLMNDLNDGFEVTFVSAGDDPECVLLTVDDTNFDGIGANGLVNSSEGQTSGDDDGRVSLNLDEANGDPPTDIFGVDFAGTDSENIGDAINPTNDGDVKFYDKDGDGNVDAVGVAFDEPMDGGITDTGWTLRKLDGATVNPIDQINPATGELVEDEVVGADDAEDDEIMITDVALVSTDTDGSGEIEADEMNNTIQFCFDPATVDWDEDGLTGSDDDEEATPGTGDASAVSIEFEEDEGDDSIADANSNAFEGDIAEDDADTDCAPPVFVHAFFFTGDNQTGGSNDQLIFEQFAGFAPATTDLGDNTENDRAALCFSEDINTGNLDGNFIQLGTMGATFDEDDDDELFTDDNCVTLANLGGLAVGLAPGVEVNLASGNGIEDGNDNEASGMATGNSGLLEDKVAPYVPYIVSVDGTTVFHNALSIDADDDGFAEQARLNCTLEINPSTLEPGDWFIDVTNGPPSALTLSETDGSILIVDFPDGIASLNNEVGVQYLAATNNVDDDDLFAGINGNPVANTDHVGLEAIDLPEAAVDNHGIAQMPVVGNIANAGRGSKVFAMIAVPKCKGIWATHNNVRFYNTDCCDAWDNYLYGIEPFVYLNREDDNDQCYVNEKDDANDTATYNDIVWINKITARDLERITFSGVGESRDDKVTSGELEMGWDVLRSNNGTLSSLFRNGVGGTPIKSSTVLLDDSGDFTMHVAAPIFEGRGNDIMSGIDFPVIFVCETPDGTRHILSSLLTSADFTNHAGGPILFRDHKADDDGGTAFDAVRVDFDIENVGHNDIFSGWNTEGYNQNGGWAERSNNVPVLASGVSEDNIVIGSDLPNVDPLDQFGFYSDSNADGMWSVLDDGGTHLGDIVVDFDCVSHFAFTCTSFGPQFSDAMTNIVGGYGVAIFNQTNTRYGMFMFGSALSNATSFSNFPNTSATNGWGLGTSQVDATGAELIAGNFDYVIFFNNIGGDGAGIDVRSIADSANNPNDLEEVSAGDAVFFHRAN